MRLAVRVRHTVTVASRPSGTFATIMPECDFKNQIRVSKLTNKEDDSFEPVIAEDKSKNEENYTEKNSNSSDDVNEMFDFLIQS